MYPGCSFRNIDCRELVHGNELTHEEYLLNSVSFVLRKSPYNVLSVCKGRDSHYDVSSSAGTADAKELYRKVMRP